MGKTVGAVVCVVGVLVLWVVCLRMLLSAARHDLGAYVIFGFVFLLLPFATVICIAGIVKERRGDYGPVRCRCHTQAEWRTNHAPVREHEAA